MLYHAGNRLPALRPSNDCRRGGFGLIVSSFWQYGKVIFLFLVFVLVVMVLIVVLVKVNWRGGPVQAPPAENIKWVWGLWINYFL